MLPGGDDTLIPIRGELGGQCKRSMGESGQRDHAHLGGLRGSVIQLSSLLSLSSYLP